MDYFADVDPQTPPDKCAKCRKGFARGERIHDVKIVAGIGSHPRGFGQTVYVSDFSEAAHASCLDTNLGDPFVELARSMLIVNKEIEPISARVPDFVCARCKKRLERGDRVYPLVIVEGVGRDPVTQGKAIQCSAEYEMIHLDCRDPKLKGGGDE